MKLLHEKNKDKGTGRIQLIIVTNEILNRKKIFNSLGMKFEQSYSFKNLKNDNKKVKKKKDKKEEKKENKK